MNKHPAVGCRQGGKHSCRNRGIHVGVVKEIKDCTGRGARLYILYLVELGAEKARKIAAWFKNPICTNPLAHSSLDQRPQPNTSRLGLSSTMKSLRTVLYRLEVVFNAVLYKWKIYVDKSELSHRSGSGIFTSFRSGRIQL